jgi:hypothetical protein
MFSQASSKEEKDVELLLGLPPCIIEATDEVMKGARAIVALTCPTPGILGSSYQDAQDLFAQESATPTTAQLILRTAVLKHNAWKRKTLAFWAEASDDSILAPAYQKRQKEWGSVTASTLTAEMIAETFKDVTAWQKKLRPGALDDLMDDITAKAKSIWKDADSGVDTSLLQGIVTNILKVRKDVSLNRNRPVRPGMLPLRSSCRHSKASRPLKIWRRCTQLGYPFKI